MVKGRNQAWHHPIQTWSRRCSRLGAAALLLTACGGGGNKSGALGKNLTDLVFASSFEPNTKVVEIDNTIGDIIGIDETTPNGDWEADLESSTAFGEARFYFEDGSASDRFTRIEPDPTGESGSVLLTEVSLPAIRLKKNGTIVDNNDVACDQDPPGARKGRIQLVLRNNAPIRKFEYQIRLRLGEAFTKLGAEEGVDNHWMTIGEYWNNLANKPYPFRITLGVHKEELAGSGLSWILKADKRIEEPDGSLTWKSVWQEHEYVAAQPVVTEQWVSLHVAVVEGNATTGRVTLSQLDASGERTTMLDVTGFTHHPDDPMPDGFRDINPIKLYTSGEVICGVRAQTNLPLQIWWDDFAIGASHD